MDLSEYIAEPMLDYWFTKDFNYDIDGYTLFIKPATEVIYKKSITIPYCINLYVAKSIHDKPVPKNFSRFKRINSILA